MTDLTVRSSSLTEFWDCERRWSARHLPAVREAYTLRAIPTSIGAVVGTALHAGVAQMLEHKIKHDALARSTADSEEIAIGALRQDMGSQSVIWDDVSRTSNEAEHQVRRMNESYFKLVAPMVRPVAVEQQMKARFSKTLVITGRLDIAEDNEILDVKSGRARRSNFPQYGSYSMLRRANGHEINRFSEHYVPRVGATRIQPPPQIHSYPIESCEQAASTIMTRIDAQAAAFEKDGNPWHWLPNPGSQLCGDKYCPAMGTDFCKVHKGA